MDLTLARAYSNLTNQLESYGSIPKDLITSFRNYTEMIYKTELQDDYSEPVPWIGMYIALGSLVCILAMMADLLHGFRNRKLLFPCKYFSLNAASLSMIAVAIKIPMDLTGLMPTRVDQITKIGSMAFMCTMMVNLLPSLASMNSQQLVANIVALGVLVITLVVNVCLQISTGVVSYPKSHLVFDKSVVVPIYADHYKVIASIYVAMLLFLLIIYTSSALAILESKRILEKKYNLAYEKAMDDLKTGRRPADFEMLKSYVTKCWIMAETVNPEFMVVCSATSSASGVICVLSTILFTVVAFFKHLGIDNHDSDYSWSIPVILVTQYIGVILGTIAPVSRCFAPLYLKMSKENIIKYCLYVFKVDSSWTRKIDFLRLSTFQQITWRIKRRLVIWLLRETVLVICFKLQVTIVVVCKMLALIPNFFILSLLFCFPCWKRLKVSTQHEPHVLGLYVLQLKGDTEATNRRLNLILKSLNRMTQKGKSQQPKNLMILLEKTSSFQGIGNLYKHLPPSNSMEYPECWSLTLVTMIAIAYSLPDIPNNKVESLCWSVGEGLAYVTHVEEIIVATSHHVTTYNSAKLLWQDFELRRVWLDKDFEDLASSPVIKTPREILEWFKITSNNILTENKNHEDIVYYRFCANTMYRITQAILLSYQDSIDESSYETLFDRLSSLISETLAACLTNLPQVIALKCQTNMTEEREASTHAAAQLLSETTEIINNLQRRNSPCFDNPGDLALMGKWCEYYAHESVP